jgi:hypothetical protein
MKGTIVSLVMLALFSCKKSMENELPPYEPELSVEMYLEDGAPLKCLLTEALPYSSDAVNKMVNNALVVFSDGEQVDTLKPAEIYDYESGRRQNYGGVKRFIADSAKSYTLTVTDSINRMVTATTNISVQQVKIDDLVYLESVEVKERFSVGLSFSDPAQTANYYRIVIGKGINNYESEHTDMLLPDVAFDGQKYSFSSGADYEINDTITVRLYTLLPDHYNYLQSAETARTANYNPFMQPVRVKTNITGGQGIFTAIVYDERRIVIR